jgi:hypothetical protein
VSQAWSPTHVIDWPGTQAVDVLPQPAGKTVAATAPMNEIDRDRNTFVKAIEAPAG